MTIGRVRMETMRVVLGMALVAMPAVATAQGAGVGVGPLTRTLTATEPSTGVLRLGDLKVTPGFTIDELGRDPNVFDEEKDPKSDWVLRATPDVALFSEKGFLRFSGYAGSELAYYHKYEDERSIGREYRARVDVLLGLLQPFVGAGETHSRTRPNGEIDVRPDRTEREAGGGIAYNFGQFQSVYAAAVVYQDRYKNAVEDGIALDTSLNRETTNYSVGVRTALTPLAQLTLSVAKQKDRFESAVGRDSESQLATASMQIGSDAALSGTIAVSYRDFKPEDPLVKRNRDIGSEVAVTYPFLDIGRLSLGYRRSLEYSFDAREAYYRENTLNLSYTHRLFGHLNVQARGSRSTFDYGFSTISPARQDNSRTVGGSVGYNIRNRTRIALNYEDARRRSPVFSDRNFNRRRVYLSWGYAY